MTIHARVLGRLGWDNSLLARVDTGKRTLHLAFDAGDGCLGSLSLGTLRRIDALFFSHAHMDHIAGFDAFVRATCGRPGEPLAIFGPPGTARIVHHRLQGYLWNLVGPGSHGAYRVHDVHPDHMEVHRFLTAEGFAEDHVEEPVPFEGIAWSTPQVRVEARILEHHGPCVSYQVVETDRLTLDTTALAEAGLRSGPWCAAVKDLQRPDEELVLAGDERFSLGELRERLLTRRPGQRVAYVTDILLDEVAMDTLVPWLSGCDTLVIECAFREHEAELARAHHHMHPAVVGRLAREAEVGEVVLIHLSDRYPDAEKAELLGEVRARFPAARLPDGWASTMPTSPRRASTPAR